MNLTLDAPQAIVQRVEEEGYLARAQGVEGRLIHRRYSSTFARSHKGEAKAFIQDSAILNRMRQILREPSTDEDGENQHPSSPALQAFADIIVALEFDAFHEGRIIPDAWITCNDIGGIRVEWRRSTNRVHLVIPGDVVANAFVYHQKNTDYGTEPANADRLGFWLKKLID